MACLGCRMLGHFQLYPFRSTPTPFSIWSIISLRNMHFQLFTFDVSLSIWEGQTHSFEPKLHGVVRLFVERVFAFYVASPTFMDNSPRGEQLELYADLQKYLQSAHLNRWPPLPETDPIVANTRDVLTALVKECFQNVSRPGFAPWYKDVALVAQTSLELFSKALTSLEGVCRGFERAWPISLLSFVGLMENWSLRDPSLDSSASSESTPSALRRRALQVLRILILSLRRDSSFLQEPEEVQMWRAAEDLETECLAAIEGKRVKAAYLGKDR